MENCKIYAVTHKKYNLSEKLISKGYELISVGNGNNEGNSGVSDNTGDNISSKNPNFCELTALYWIWKNDDKSKYKGLCHYRRYLTSSAFSADENYFIGDAQVKELLESKKYDIILPEIQFFTRTASENYLRCGYQKDIDTTRKVISEKYPEYTGIFDEVFSNNKSYLTNMMITSSELFDEYCEWLFNILFEVEKRTDLTGYSVQEARIYGYLSERLLTVWVLGRKLKIKEFHFINTEEKRNFKYIVKQFMINFHIYQMLKCCYWSIKKFIKNNSYGGI